MERREAMLLEYLQNPHHLTDKHSRQGVPADGRELLNIRPGLINAVCKPGFHAVVDTDTDNQLAQTRGIALHLHQYAAELSALVQNVVWPLELQPRHGPSQGPTDTHADSEAEPLEKRRAAFKFPPQGKVQIAAKGADPVAPATAAATRLPFRQTNDALPTGVSRKPPHPVVGGDRFVQQGQLSDPVLDGRRNIRPDHSGIRELQSSRNTGPLPPDTLHGNGQLVELFELLPNGGSGNTQLRAQSLTRVKIAIGQKRYQVFFQHGNSRDHVLTS